MRSPFGAVRRQATACSVYAPCTGVIVRYGMNYTRRDLGRLALASLPAATLLAKPNSKFGGVHLGINVPYSYKDMAMSADEVLSKTVQLGISAVELRSQPV